MSLAALSLALQLLGLALDMSGVVLMANGYIRVVPSGQTIWLLASALRRGKPALEAVRHGDLTPEDRLSVLRGLALVGLGFLLQGLGSALALLVQAR